MRIVVWAFLFLLALYFLLYLFFLLFLMADSDSGDNEHPVQLRQRDLRHPGRILPRHSFRLLRNCITSEPKGWIRESTNNGPVLEVTPITIKKARTWNQNWFFIRRQFSILGENFERTQQVRERFHRKNREFQTKKRTIQHERGNPVHKNWESNRILKNKKERPSAKAKLEPNSSSIQQSSLEQVPILERRWRDVEPDPNKYSTLSHDISKRMLTLLRHEQDILRQEDGAVEFWRLKRDIYAHLRQFSTFCTLVKQHLGRTPLKRRRTKEEIPVLHKSHWNSNSLLQGSPRSFGRNYCGSISVGQRVDSRTWLIRD